AILIGDGPLVPTVAQAFADAGLLSDRRSELLFPLPFDMPAIAPDQMPDTMQVCDGTAVSKAQIVDAVLRGASSLQAVCELTRAATGCGSCRPQVQKIVEMARLGVEAPELLAPPPVLEPASASAADDE